MLNCLTNFLCFYSQDTIFYFQTSEIQPPPSPAMLLNFYMLKGRV